METRLSCHFIFLAKRLQGIISSVGLPLSNLSQSGLTSVRTLANTALLLDLKDTKMSR